MSRLFAFLRAVNVGGRVVKMNTLRRLFEEVGAKNVETFIASGNVIFDAPCRGPAVIEKQIEAHLKQALGYEVATFVRTAAELSAIAAYQAFDPSDIAAAHAVHVTFLRDAPDAKTAQRIEALPTDVDRFHLQGRELYWLCRVRILESKVPDRVLAKVLGAPGTARNLNTVRRLAEKYIC